jgi:phosphohistidine phosphatase
MRGLDDPLRGRIDLGRVTALLWRIARRPSLAMLRLVLLRHAKAAPQGGGDDHGRPLALRGREDAPRVGAWLAGRGIVPALCLVSDARRTRETFDGMASAFAKPLASRLEPRLYHTSAKTMLGVIRETAAAANTLMLVGHNPGMADSAIRLAGEGDDEAWTRMRQGFPTASVAVLDFDAKSWAGIGFGDGRLVYFVTPSMLGGEDM